VSRRADLARHKDVNGSVLVDIELTVSGDIRVGRFDCGPLTNKLLGGDYEKDVYVSADMLPALCFAMLEERLAGRLDALDELKQVCIKAGVPVQESSWS
jgi:hypothetical protein